MADMDSDKEKSSKERRSKSAESAASDIPGSGPVDRESGKADKKDKPPVARASMRPTSRKGLGDELLPPGSAVVRRSPGRLPMKSKRAAAFQADVGLLEIKGMVQAMDPITMSPQTVVGVMEIVEPLLGDERWRRELLDLGYFQHLVKYAHHDNINTALLSLFYNIFSDIEQNKPGPRGACLEAYARQNLNLPLLFRPNLHLTITDDDSHETVYKTAFIIAQICGTSEGRSETKNALCLPLLLAMWKTVMPADVLVQILSALLQCLESGTATVEALFPKINAIIQSEASEPTDFLDDLLDVHLYSEYRMVQKLTLQLLDYLVLSPKVRLLLMQRDVILKLAEFLEMKEYQDLHGHVYSVLVLLWLHHEAVMITCCGKCRILKMVMGALEANMLDSVEDASTALRVLHNFTFRMCKDEKRRKPGMLRSKRDIELQLGPAEEGDPEPSQAYVEHHLKLLIRNDMDLMVIDLLMGLDTFSSSDRDVLARKGLDLLQMWWKERSSTLPRHLVEKKPEFAKELLNYIIVEDSGSCPKFALPQTCFLALQTIVWCLQKLSIVRSYYLGFDITVPRLMDVLRVYGGLPSYVLYAMRAACILIQESADIAGSFIGAGMVKTLFGMYRYSRRVQDSDLEELALIGFSYLWKRRENLTVQAILDYGAGVSDFVTAIANHGHNIAKGILPAKFRATVALVRALCKSRPVAEESFRCGILFHLYTILNSKAYYKHYSGVQIFHAVERLRSFIINTCTTAKFAVHGKLDEEDSVLEEFYMDTEHKGLTESTPFSLRTMILDGTDDLGITFIPPLDRNLTLMKDFFMYESLLGDNLLASSQARFMQLVQTAQFCFRESLNAGQDFIKVQLTKMARLVYFALGGAVVDDTYDLALSRKRGLTTVGRRPIPVTAFIPGVFLHRALLFKGLCDVFDIPCTLERSPSGRHAWNLVSTSWKDASRFALLVPKFKISVKDRRAQQSSKDLLDEVRGVLPAEDRIDEEASVPASTTSAPDSWTSDPRGTADTLSSNGGSSSAGKSSGTLSSAASQSEVSASTSLSSRSESYYDSTTPGQNQGELMNPELRLEEIPVIANPEHNRGYLLREIDYRPTQDWFSVDLAYHPGIMELGTYADLKYRDLL